MGMWSLNGYVVTLRRQARGPQRRSGREQPRRQRLRKPRQGYIFNTGPGDGAPYGERLRNPGSWIAPAIFPAPAFIPDTCQEFTHYI